MKKPKQPSKPSEPVKPVLPAKEIAVRHTLEYLDDKVLHLKSLIQEHNQFFTKNNLSVSDVFIEDESYDGSYKSVVIYTYIKEPIEDWRYDLLIKDYDKRLKKYEKKLIDYNIKLKEYENKEKQYQVEKKKYDVWVKEQDKQQKLKQFEKLKKELKL